MRIESGEAWLIGAHIAEYAQGNRYNHAPAPDRASSCSIATRSASFSGSSRPRG